LTRVTSGLQKWRHYSGDPTKAKEKLGWVPEITVQEMCSEMVANDLSEAKQHALLKKYGFDVSVSAE
jgi:GDPmannose 4,6-dehydratase